MSLNIPPVKPSASNKIGIFARNSTIKELWPQHEYRPEQESMAKAVTDCLERQEILLIEAGTGVGKTLAYLLPLLEFAKHEKKRVVISTETKSLQQQILKKDLAIAEKLLGTKIDAQICLGANNFVCRRRLQATLDAGEVDSFMSSRLDEFAHWMDVSPNKTRQDYKGQMSNTFWQKINRDPSDCLAKRCPYFDSSPYFVARRRWHKAQLLIVNHSLLASHFALDAKLLPEFQYLIVDEAHRFPEMLQNAFTVKGSVQELRALINDIQPNPTAQQKKIVDLVSDFYTALEKLLPEGGGQKTLRVREENPMPSAFVLIQELEKMGNNLREKLKLMTSQQSMSFSKEEGENSHKEALLSNTPKSKASKISKKSKKTQSATPNLSDMSGMEFNLEWLRSEGQLNKIEKFSMLLERLVTSKDIKEVVWIESKAPRSSSTAVSKRKSPNKDIIIYCASLADGNFAQDKVFAYLSAAVLTSATLTSGGAKPFQYVMEEIGLNTSEAAQTKLLDSPFDYKKQVLLYLPNNIANPAHAQDNYYSDITREIEKLLELSAGGAFVLFTSIYALKKTHEILEEATKSKERSIPYEIFSQIRMGSESALSAFRENKHGVLFGLATFWQGIDIPGDQLRSVIITKLPFRPPDEPILAARMEAQERLGNNPFMTLQLPAAILSMRQGFGRLIRSGKDRGIVAILDPRLHSTRYGREILNALPSTQQYQDFKQLSSMYKKLMTPTSKSNI